MKINELQKEIAELLIYIAEWYPNSQEEVDDSLSSKLCDIYYKVLE